MSNMEDFKIVFGKFIEKLSGSQVETISKFSKKYNIGTEWWGYFLKKHLDDYCGKEFLNSLLENFIFYGIITHVEKLLLNYFPTDGKNMFGDDYVDCKIENLAIEKDNFSLDISEVEEFEEFIKPLSLDNKLELMKDKLFSDIINQTNIKIYSKKDIRAIKLRELDGE